MSGFLSRWARKKAAATKQAPAPIPAGDAVAIDEADLPKIETLTGASDITAFLAAGVSDALQTRALRVIWEGDAQIASFRGMAEYDWDFNAEGYGRLAATDDVVAMLRQVIGAPEEPDSMDHQPASGDVAVAGKEATDTVRVSAAAPALPSSEVDPGHLPSTAEAEAGPAEFRPPARRHGGALPA